MIRKTQGVNMIENVRRSPDCGNGNVEIVSICPQKCPLPGQRPEKLESLPEIVRKNPWIAVSAVATALAILGVPALASLIYMGF